MTQIIDPIKLKAAAENLEWVLKQYPSSEDVQSLLRALKPLIEDAKEKRMSKPLDRMAIPGAWNFSDGRYIPYGNPSVDNAYVDFSIECRGGLTDAEKKLIARMEALFKSQEGGSHERK